MDDSEAKWDLIKHVETIEYSQTWIGFTISDDEKWMLILLSTAELLTHTIDTDDFKVKLRRRTPRMGDRLLSFLPNSHRFMLARGSVLRVYDIENFEPALKVFYMTGPLKIMNLTRSGLNFASLDTDHNLQYWSTLQSDALADLRISCQVGSQIVFTPQEDNLIFRDSDYGSELQIFKILSSSRSKSGLKLHLSQKVRFNFTEILSVNYDDYFKQCFAITSHSDIMLVDHVPKFKFSENVNLGEYAWNATFDSSSGLCALACDSGVRLMKVRKNRFGKFCYIPAGTYEDIPYGAQKMYFNRESTRLYVMAVNHSIQVIHLKHSKAVTYLFLRKVNNSRVLSLLKHSLLRELEKFL
eukprot:CAMPEP_0115001292 /NCGR_PEP_ID=MMETSP0216-20121206/17287_1 /TAXON_ID=223996 /ORGANISM="Protocruzia adherens, Strain Boccale" /LENGTH=354 /DNA_ID=CAMNT_0002366595 /DNA_START=37 /DNA_END=1101 /DNA_ORIENTATION=-